MIGLRDGFGRSYFNDPQKNMVYPNNGKVKPEGRLTYESPYAAQLLYALFGAAFRGPLPLRMALAPPSDSKG